MAFRGIPGRQAARRSAETFAPPPPGPAAVQLRRGRGRHERPPQQPPERPPAEHSESEERGEPQADWVGATEAPLSLADAIEALGTAGGYLLSAIPRLVPLLHPEDPEAGERFTEDWIEAVKVGDGPTLHAMANQLLGLTHHRPVPDAVRREMAESLAEAIGEYMPPTVQLVVSDRSDLVAAPVANTATHTHQPSNPFGSGPPIGRSPEEVRSMLSSYRSGLERGRQVAENATTAPGLPMPAPGAMVPRSPAAAMTSAGLPRRVSRADTHSLLLRAVDEQQVTQEELRELLGADNQVAGAAWASLRDRLMRAGWDQEILGDLQVELRSRRGQRAAQPEAAGPRGVFSPF
jgi:hypothetical protein